MKYTMVVNMGLKSIRCIVFDQNGTKLSSAAEPIKTAINEERVEQQPREWWDKAEQVMRKAYMDSCASRIDFITVTASASCLVCVDKQGEALGSAFMISDKRAVIEADEIAEMGAYEKTYEDTGLCISASLMLPRILWVKKHMPQQYEKTVKFLTPNDYMIYKMSGKYITDYFNAMKYHYNPRTERYPSELLKQMGADVSTLPDVVEPGTIIGELLSQVAENTTINKDAKIVVTSYDAICSFWGSGVSEDGEASDVSGTVTVLRTLSKRENVEVDNRIYSLPFKSEKSSIVGGSNNLGGGLIEWVKQCYYQKEEYPYEVMEKDASESELGAKGLIFLPYLLGERTPIWDDDARGVFFGLERMHTRKDMTRAVFESAGFIDMDIISAIEQNGVHVENIRLSGGLARVNLVSQIKADILGKDVCVLSEFETTSTGAAMMAFVGGEVYPDLKATADKFARIRMIIKPDMEHHRKYQEVYALYKETYQTVKPLFIRRKEILKNLATNREVQIENL